MTTPVVLVVEHEAACPPAHVGRWLEEAGCSVALCRPYDGDPLPALASYDALVVLGGSVGANDDAQAPWLTPLKEMVARAPRNPRGQQVGLIEQGWLPEAPDDPLLAGSALPRRGVQWNDDIVTDLPEGARLLAATPEGEPQVVRFAPTVWGVQSHPEVDVTVLASWADGDRDDHLEKGIDQAAVLAEIEAAADELEASWRPVLTRFAALTGR